MEFKNKEPKQKYFHCYATANDSRIYLKDIQNLMRLKSNYSGFSKIILLIAISEVNKISFFDRFFVENLKNIFHNHPFIELREIYFKGNIGRDFSSYQTLLNKVKKTANDDDFILFQNRSGYGPFQENWYKKFVNQFEKFDSIAICGSTINFNDHPLRSLSNNLPHIQTYSFLTKVFYMKMFGDIFPGSNQAERLNIICDGEIELSQFFLRKKHKITCIEWPDEEISNQTNPISLLDIKAKVVAKHYFYHRKYFRKHTQIIPDIITLISFIYQGLKNKLKKPKQRKIL
jgi:hypothetical protein